MHVVDRSGLAVHAELQHVPCGQVEEGLEIACSTLLYFYPDLPPRRMGGTGRTERIQKNNAVALLVAQYAVLAEVVVRSDVLATVIDGHTGW